MNVTLRQLQAFVTVARLGSFVQAAGSMALTQGALSHLIRDLEASVGARLLDRTTRSVRLSKAGEVYLPHAERVLSDVAGAAHCARDLRDGKVGSVRIATTHLLAAVKLAALIAQYHDQEPGTRVSLVDAGNDALVPMVARGEVDLALGPERPLTDDVSGQLVFRDDLQLVCAPQHRLARRRRVAWRELQGERFIMSGPGAALRTMADIDFALTIEPAIQVELFTTSIALVAARQGILVATSYVRPFADMYGLRMVPLVDPLVRRRVLLLRHAGQGLSPAAERFAGFVLKELAAGD